MKKIQRQAEFVLHAVIVATLLINSISLIVNNMAFPGLIIAGLSIIAMAITLFWRPFKMVPKEARLISYYLECPALLLCSFMLGRQHLQDLAHIYLLAGMVVPLVGYLTSFKIKKTKKRVA